MTRPLSSAFSRRSSSAAEATTSPPYSCTPLAEVVYIRDVKQANDVLSKLASGPLGFDMEWRPKYVKGAPDNPVALIQLATTDAVYLIQVSAMTEFPNKLRDVLGNPDIVKTGVGIQSDAMKLHTDYSVSTRACVDLSLFARSVDNQRWKGRYRNAIALSRLVDTYTEQSLPKASSLRLSDWQGMLTPRQLQYAANDAHAGLTVYNHLSILLSSTTPVPSISCYSFDCVQGYLCQPSGAFWYAYNPDYDSGLPPPKDTNTSDGSSESQVTVAQNLSQTET